MVASIESTGAKGRRRKKLAILCVDASAVGGRSAREQLLSLIRGAGHTCRSFGSFWGSFASRPDELPEGVLVLGDLAAIVRRYTQSSPHEWIGSVREKRPYFVGLVRTKTDERSISTMDDLARSSDMRLSLCRDVETDFPECLHRAASALEPHSLVDVRYSPLTRQLWVQFSDGLFGLVLWGALGLRSEVNNLMLQTATVGSSGATVDILTHHGDLFSIGGGPLRNVLTAFCPPGAHRTGVGGRVWLARVRTGMSQTELASKTGMHQTRISRLERGCHHPRPHTLERVAAALGCATTEFSPKDETEPMDKTLFHTAKPGPRH